jgi:ADP-ribose pyrophosphatase
MKIVEDIVELPNGKQTTYIREAPGGKQSVTIIACNKSNEILLQREYSYPPDAIMYQLPGGGIENGEDIIVAANRELSEESGYIAKTSKIIGSFHTNNRRSDSKQYVVVSKNLEPQKTPGDDEEFIESTWVSLDTLKKLIRNGEITNMNLLATLQLFETVSD